MFPVYFSVLAFHNRIIVERITKRTNITYYILRKRAIYYLILNIQKNKSYLLHPTKVRI